MSLPRGPSSDALGAVRDGAAALQALAQLLRSPLVGPRQLSRVLPEMQAGAEALAQDFQRSIDAFCLTFAATPALSSAAEVALGLMRDRVAAFAGSLRASADKNVDTRQRLSLEGATALLSRDLDTALCVLDLLTAAAAPRSVRIAFCELVRERRPGPAPIVVRAVVDAPDTVASESDPHLILALLELVVARLAPDPRRDKLQIRARSVPSGRVEVSVQVVPAAEPPARGRPGAHDPKGLAPVDLPVRVHVAEADEVAAQVAAGVGVGLSFGPGTATLTL